MKRAPAFRVDLTCGRPTGRARRALCALTLSTLLAHSLGWAQEVRTFGTEGGIAAAESPERRNSPGSAEQFAERLYGEGELDAALKIFRRHVARDPEDAFAWLRIGNIEHRKMRLLPAASAYRKAASVANGLRGAHRQIRAKALLNLATVNLELAGQVIAEYDRGGDGVDSVQAKRIRQQAGQELDSIRHQIEARSNSAATSAHLPEPSQSASGTAGLGGTAVWPQSPVLPGLSDPQGAQ